MYAENEPVMKRNDAVLNVLPGELCTTEADGKIPDICKYPLATIQAAQNQKQTNTGCLAKFLKLKVGAKVMLTVNLYKIVQLMAKQEILARLNLSKVVLKKYMSRFLIDSLA